MLDRDLAALYGTATKALNLAVKRNIDRFPIDFMFLLTKSEYENVINRNGSRDDFLRFQIETSKGRGGNRYLPYAFTEQGVAMLSAVLHSDTAIKMNIAIMRTFVEIRRVRLEEAELKTYINNILVHLDVHDSQLNQVFAAIENLIDEKQGRKKWEERDRIGFDNKKIKNSSRH